MSETIINHLKDPIVAIALKDPTGELRILYLEEAIQLRDIDFQDDYLRIGSFFVLYHWFSSVVICTQEILTELLRKIGKPQKIN